VPETAIGAILAMADKADTLAGCFGLNMIPTGSADPYALRRHALGICRIVMDKGFRLDLAELLGKAQELYGEREWKLFPEQALEALLDFFAQRLKNYFTAKGYATLAVEAAVGAGIRDVWALRARLEALDAFSREPDFEQAVLTFKRAGNIIRKQGREAGQELTGQYRADLLQEEQEKALAAALEEMRPRFEALWQADDYPALMALLRELRPRVDDFFDHVMVMCEDEALRANRLNLLQALVEPLSRLADFNALQV
jgi:glycyl-tRNA synthetase beta chain